jgi:hypothetical protein
MSDANVHPNRGNGPARDVLDYIDAVYGNLRSFGITEDDEPRRWGKDEDARRWYELTGRERSQRVAPLRAVHRG